MQTNFRSLIEGTAEYPVAFVSSAAFNSLMNESQ